MVYNFQAENAHISKQINKIMFVWNVTNEMARDNVMIWTQVPTN
jgi:hypothetical protein